MTLEQIKNAFNTVSLQHIDIKEFYVGDSFSVAVSPKTKYPIVFMEIPYNISYADNRRLKNYSFALLVLFKTKTDDIDLSHKAISSAEDIGDAIISKIQNDYKSDFIISGINALSVDQFSDDLLAGVRFELTTTVNREYSLPICYADKFNPAC
jgi:hypothetical protein